MQINGNHQCNASNRSDTLRHLTRCLQLDKEKLRVATAFTHEIAEQLAHNLAERWRVAEVIAALKLYSDRSEAIAACIRYYEANADRMRYDLYRELGLPVGSGVVESACKQIVGSRFKRAGCHWSKAGANALLAVKCCFENRRWADFLDWRACQVAAA